MEGFTSLSVVCIVYTEMYKYCISYSKRRNRKSCLIFKIGETITVYGWKEFSLFRLKGRSDSIAGFKLRDGKVVGVPLARWDGY